MSSRCHRTSSLEPTASQMQELARSMVEGSDSLRMESVVKYATAAINGAQHGAISLSRAGRAPVTVFSTDEVPLRIDSLQYSLDEGPCVAALSESDLVWVNDMTADDEFPRFAPRAVEQGVRSMLSTRLFLTPHDRAALNLYSSRSHAFDFDDLPLAAIFGSFASLVLMHHIAEEKVVQLERALESNREISVAIGILMAQQRLTREQAFAQLSNASQSLNRRLRDIADEVSQTGQLPGT